MDREPQVPSHRHVPEDDPAQASLAGLDFVQFIEPFDAPTLNHDESTPMINSDFTRWSNNGGTNLACRGFVWENGVMHNLNDLVDSDDVLLSAQDINDAGVITGRLLDHVTGETVMYVASPR